LPVIVDVNYTSDRTVGQAAFPFLKKNVLKNSFKEAVNSMSNFILKKHILEEQR
jgi:hypothetical protein